MYRIKKLNYTINDWLNKNLDQSDSEWFIAVFKINGTYLDKFGCNRQIVNDLSFGKMTRALDWTISTIKRNYSYPTMQFVPFVGGDKESGVKTHIHAFIEIPSGANKYEFSYRIRRRWSEFVIRSFKFKSKDIDKNKEFIASSVWFDDLDKSRAKFHSYYVGRYEGKTFMYGHEKILVECECCYLSS